MQTRTPFGHLHSRFITVDPCKMFKPFDFCLTSLGCFWLCCFILYPSKPPPCRRHCGTAASYWSTRVIVHCPGCRQRSHWSAVLCCTPSSHNLPHCTLLCTHLHFITLDHIWSIPTVGVESAVSVSFRYTLFSICWYKAAHLLWPVLDLRTWLSCVLKWLGSRCKILDLDLHSGWSSAPA